MATATGSDLLPTRSHELLQRADAELVAAQFSSEAWERFSHAHLAALRGGAALVAVRGRPGGRRPPRTVWDMLRVVAPELERWSDCFAGGAGLRSAIEAGRFDAVSEERAEQALCAAEDFIDELRALLTTVASPIPPVHAAASRRLGVRAS
ncbi:MAG TPA: SAV_6107 family HEPN domain-containing protein [Cellulomonas sp.]